MALLLWKFSLIILLEIFILCSFCRAEKAPYYTFLHEATTAPRKAFYDYIIIGGGTAGCPLAATLSENARVLVLERGGSPYDNPNITNIAGFADTLADLSPNSPSQLFISEDAVYNTRARVLGGGSALNAGFYTHASDEYVKEAGWSKKLVKNSFQWVENKVVFEPAMLQWQSAVRDGLLEIGVSPNNGFTFDHIYGTKVGGTIFDKNGQRHTAADLLEYAHPQNISVYLHATVRKILISGRDLTRQRPRAYGVIYEDSLGIRKTAYLTRNKKSEVILAAGALGSPQLLMLSGIGAASHLRAHGIPLVLDQPLVGQGMADNPMNILFVPSPQPVEVSLVQVVGIPKFGSFIEAASGLSLTKSLTQRFVRDYAQAFNKTGESYSVTPEIMAKAIDTLNSLTNSTFEGGVILEKIIGPLSTGELKLKTSNPHDNPLVKFNYFKEPEDLKRCVEGMETIIDIINSNSFSKFRYEALQAPDLLKIISQLPLNLRPRHLNTATSLEQFCIDTVMTIWHYHGGCQVGKVVDQDYKVIGVDGLRVIDGSTFITSPGTNPQATLMMLGRYMGRKITTERFL